MNNFKNKVILVTGGAGFLGSHLINKLIEDATKIVCIDDLSTGNLSNIKNIDSPKINFIENDIRRDLSVLEDKFDYIFNLACPASPVHYQSDPIKTLETSVKGIQNILGICKRDNSVMLHASTSEIYGDPKIHPQTEDYWGNVNTIGPRSCYDEGKRVAETYIYEYWRKYGLDVRIARIFNTYGPNMAKNDGRVISNFINQCLKNEEITVYGDGSQTRSFCYVDDLIDGFMKLISKNFKKNLTDLPLFNLGNPTEFTIREIAELIKKETCSTSNINFHDLPVDDPLQRKPNIKKAEKILAWKPRINVPDGIRTTIDYFKEIDNG